MLTLLRNAREGAGLLQLTASVPSRDARRSCAAAAYECESLASIDWTLVRAAAVGAVVYLRGGGAHLHFLASA